MPNNDYANEPNQSRSEDIIQSILDNTEYDEEARSRIEYLLIELKNAIEGGGGGGGVTSYSPLTEKPKIDNHTLQAGNNTSSDLGLQTKLTFDSTPTESSTNPVTSGGVYTALGTKANSSDVYNKSAVDTALSAKADKSTTYTKTEVDTALSSKQNTISDLSTIRSGAALGATAVQPVSGKGLSTNDYTNDEKSKLAGIEAQANKTTVDSALSGTSTNPVQNKVVKSALDDKQATLTTAQLVAVNSGIDSDDVAQITTNKNNILLKCVYCTCRTASSTAEKVVNAPNGFVLQSGCIIGVLFSNNNAAANVTLNVGGTGAISIAYGITRPYRGTFTKITGYKDAVNYYMYDGSYWVFLANGITYSNMAQSEASAGSSTTDRLITAKVLSDTIDEKLIPVENNILSLYKSGSANILKNTAQTQVLGGVTFTMNADGSITANGTKNNNDWLYLSTGNSLKAGTYVLSSGGITGSDKIVVVATADSLGSAIMTTDTATGVYERELTQDYSNLYYAIRIASGTVCNNVTFKPMLCEKNVYEAINGEFQSYAMSNAEITAWILAHS